MDINDKFRKYYAEQGVADDLTESFDIDSLDYVYWGNNSVAFPSFFEVEELSEITGYVYSGFHGPEGVRVTAATLVVGQPDPRNENYQVTRLLSAMDLNGINIVLVGLSPVNPDHDPIEAKVAPYVHVFQSLEPLSNIISSSFGPLPLHAVDFDKISEGAIWTIHG